MKRKSENLLTANAANFKFVLYKVFTKFDYS